MVVGVDRGDDLGAVGEVDDQAHRRTLVDDVTDRPRDAAAAAGRGAGVEALGPQHHRHRVPGDGVRAAGDIDDRATVEARPARRRRCRLERSRQQVGGTDEPGDEDARRSVVDLLGCADLLDATAAHHGDAVAHRQRLALVVGDEDERDVDLALDALELDLHRLAQLEVEGGQRLVEEQGAGHVDERPGEGDTLLLATRQLVRAAAGELAEADDVEHLARSTPGIVGAGALGPQSEGHVVEDGHVGEQGVLLEHRVDVALVWRHAPTSSPSSMTRPALGCSKPAMIFSSVVLPHPDGPSSEKNSPRPIEKSARSTAT